MRYRKPAIIALALVLSASCGALLGYTFGRFAGGSQPSLSAPTTPAGFSPPIELAPGMAVERDFGVLTFAIRVDGQLARVDIGASLGGRKLAQAVLTPESPTLELDLANGDMAVRGSLAVRFAYPPGRSTLIGDVTLTQAGSAARFAGELAAWPSPSGLLLARRVVWPTPELRVESDILLDAGSGVIVRLLAGPQTIATFTLSQDANSVVDTQAYAIGSVRVAAGLRLRLRPATPTQDGQITLIGTFGSSDHPSVAYAGAIASWRYLVPESAR